MKINKNITDFKNYCENIKCIHIKELLARKVVLIILAISFLPLFNFSKVRSIQPKNLTVISYNIHYGIGMDGKYDLERIAKIISDQKPDIVGLQEIKDSAMAAEFGRLTGMMCVFGQSLGRMNGYGDAILCRHPFKWVGNFSIPSASSSRYQAMAIDVNLADIYGEGTEIRFINTHFDWLKTLGSEEARQAAVEVIEKGFCKDTMIPSILTGDLNATPESKTLKKLIKYGWVFENLGKDLKTIESNNLVNQIDYVLFRSKKQWNVMDVRVLDEQMASDHLPVVMNLNLKK